MISYKDAIGGTTDNIKKLITDAGSFRESLHKGWITTDVLTETLRQFQLNVETTEDYEKAVKSLVDSGYSEEEAKQKNAFQELGKSIKDAATDRKVGLFLLAFFFYIDGVYTIIDMATAYGTSLGLDTVGLLAALLVTQLVAFPSAIIIGRLSRTHEARNIILVCIVAYFFICLYGIQLDKLSEFWILAVAVGMFQGGIQAMSRSYFTKIIPAEKTGEYFGLYDIIGKGASFIGTAVVGFVADATGHSNWGVGALTLFFLIGGALFYASFHEGKKGKPEELPVEEPEQVQA